jgi:hypothetical protein
MTDTANPTVPERGVFRRALAGAWAFVQTLESGGSDYTLDRRTLTRSLARLWKLASTAHY